LEILKNFKKVQNKGKISLKKRKNFREKGWNNSNFKKINFKNLGHQRGKVVEKII